MQLGMAREDRVQARAALLPGVDYNNGFIYTEGNGTPRDGLSPTTVVHEYISQGAVQQVVGLAQVADYRRAAAAQALARAKAEIAARGLTVTVVQAFYGLLAAQERTRSTQAAADEAQHFLDNSRKLEQGGEVAHSDVIKAQIQANDQQRALQDAKLSEQNARLSLAVLLFPNFFQDFSLVDDLAAAPALPPIDRGATDGAEEQSRTERRFRRARSRQPRSHGRARRTSADAGARLLLRHRRQPFRRQHRRHPQPGLFGHGNAQYSGVALGRDREQGEASGVATSPGASGAECGAASGDRRLAIVLR